MKVKEYHEYLRNEVGCCITVKKPAVLHHVTGGSVGKVGIKRGKGTKVSDWLVIPLSDKLHKELHQGGVWTWERTYGSQLRYLYAMMELTGLPIFDNAMAEWLTPGLDGYGPLTTLDRFRRISNQITISPAAAEALGTIVGRDGTPAFLEDYCGTEIRVRD